jgi:DNA polymerase-3 subunit beta
MGDVEEEIDADLNGDDIDIAFNAKYIIDVIRNVSDDELYMNFNTNVSPCVVMPPSGESYVYLILPVRVFQ